MIVNHTSQAIWRDAQFKNDYESSGAKQARSPLGSITSQKWQRMIMYGAVVWSLSIYANFNLYTARHVTCWGQATHSAEEFELTCIHASVAAVRCNWIDLGMGLTSDTRSYDDVGWCLISLFNEGISGIHYAVYDTKFINLSQADGSVTPTRRCYSTV